jgi:hypothetical protein
MGEYYSRYGYINAVLRRSEKTILVEGVTDKIIVQRLIAEETPISAKKELIDHAGILGGEDYHGYGNKDKVIDISSVICDIENRYPQLKYKLSTLRDREWDGLSINGIIPDGEWEAPFQIGNNFITQGHSIENYFNDSGCIKNYLINRFPEHFSTTLASTIDDRFDAVLVLAAVTSLFAKNKSLLSKLCGLITLNHVTFKDGRYYLSEEFDAALITRNIDSLSLSAYQINELVDRCWLNLYGDTTNKWITHGHIGSDIVWACVADIGIFHDISSDNASAICRGFKDERLRYCAGWLAVMASVNREPLDSLISWAMEIVDT